MKLRFRIPSRKGSLQRSTVHLTNCWGVILASTETGAAAVGRVPLEILLALSRSAEGTSTVETGSGVVRSISILDEDERIVGRILVVSTKSNW